MKKFFIFTFTLLLMLTQFTFAKEYSNDYLKVQLIIWIITLNSLGIFI